eukprot:6676313-Prymnesium_polylepis.1
MEAAGVAVAKHSTPAVQPAQHVGRPRKDSKNRYGCVVGLEEHEQETEHEEETTKKAADDK